MDDAPVCWFCDAPIPPEEILAEGFLTPRRTRDGGPFRRFDCPSCGYPVGAEHNAAGEFLLVPVEDLGLTGRIAALFDRERAMLRAHARAWFRVNTARRRAFHDTPPRHRSPPPPHEPPPRDRTTRSKEARTDDARNRDGRSQHRRGAPRTDAPPPRPAPPSIEELYVRLELDPGADADAVAKAFRKLSKRCHPDKVAHLDEDFQALAHRKFVALREAYDVLMSRLSG